MENNQEINIQALIEKGKAKGSLTSSEILEAFPDENLDIEAIDKIYEELENNGIEINYLDEEPVDLDDVTIDVEQYESAEDMEKMLVQEGLSIDDPVLSLIHI